MPAITVEHPLVLPRVAAIDPGARARPVSAVVPARHAIEGAGFEVRRPFPGGLDPHIADPFFLLDQLGPVENPPGTAVGAPWHPHRGFETVTYVIDGVVEHDGGALVRLIAGDLGGHAGPGSTHTPITYAHVSLSPDAQLGVAWSRAFNAMAYVLSGRGYAGTERRPVEEHQLVVFGDGDTVTVGAAPSQPDDSPNLEVLLLGGLPIREPIAHYGPFLMNTRQEILDAIEDFRAGRMGSIPAIPAIDAPPS